MAHETIILISIEFDFQLAAIGQEFVIESDKEELLHWVKAKIEQLH